MAREAKGKGRQANRCFYSAVITPTLDKSEGGKPDHSTTCGLTPPPQQEMGLKSRHREDYKTKKNKNNRIMKDQKVNFVPSGFPNSVHSVRLLSHSCLRFLPHPLKN